jgi:hypothetical protein
VRITGAHLTDPPPLRTVDVLIPVGILFQGAKFASCPASVLTGQGPGGCPAGAVLGTGNASGDAGGIAARAPIVIVNGGGDRVLLFVTLSNPLRLRAIVTGTVDALAGGGYRLRLVVPDELRVAAGIPVALREVDLAVGRRDWLATTACPAGGRWDYEAQATFADGQRAANAAGVVCR